MRIAICGIHIESSTFAPQRAGAADFEVLRGRALLGRYPFLAPGSELAAHDWLPILHARALPGGPVLGEVYRAWSHEILDELERAHAQEPLDGVFLDIHGAMSVIGMDDAEGDLAQAVRARVGERVLLSAAMDLHGNVSEALFDACDLLTCYRTAPHVDTWETRERAVRELIGVVGSGRPSHHRALVHVPLLLPGEKTSTRVEPARSLYASIPGITARPGVHDASIYIGFAWADEPRCRAAVVVHGSDADAVAMSAQELGTAVWRARHDFDFVGPARSLEEAVDEALASSRRPFFISDSGDNPGAGGACDTTQALAALLGRDEVVRGKVSVLVASLVDPAAVEAAVAAGVGGTVSVAVGGRIDARPPGPVEVVAQVRNIVDAGAHGGGTSAVLRVGGLDVVVTTVRTQFGRAEMFDRLGVPLGGHDVVVVKMGYLEPDLDEAQRGWVIALTGGAVDQRLTELGHHRIARPTIPFDADAPEPTGVRTATTTLRTPSTPGSSHHSQAAPRSEA
jgi:microcystin degradation protein MlrC